MGLAGKQLLVRRIGVNSEVSHARISTTVVTSRMSWAGMTYLVRKRAVFKGTSLRKEAVQGTWMRGHGLLVCLTYKTHGS